MTTPPLLKLRFTDLSNVFTYILDFVKSVDSSSKVKVDKVEIQKVSKSFRFYQV